MEIRVLCAAPSAEGPWHDWHVLYNIKAGILAKHAVSCPHFTYGVPDGRSTTTHYLKSDDVHIAYQVFGEGSLDLLFVPGFVSNIEAIWESPDHRAFFRRLASFCRALLFDKRGTGMSDRGS